jgi:hypothetical protein
MRNNVIMGYDVPAILADGTCEIRNGFCFGSGNRNLMVAVRARTIGCFTHGFMASTLKIDGPPIHENLACTGFLWFRRVIFKPPPHSLLHTGKISWLKM